jgi:hypothetical protein
MMQPAQASESLAQASLRELQRRFPLPPAWTLEESFMQDLSIDSLTLFMVGLVALTTHGGEQRALGSSTQADGYPVDRAYFELLERISIYEARGAEQPLDVRDASGALLGQRSAARVFPPDVSPRLRTSLSNGVALHATWQDACRSALHELIERDRILRSFAGELSPRRLALPPTELTRALAARFDAAAYEIGPALRHRTAMLFMTPREPSLPMTYGFGTDYTLEGALARAEREAMQRLAFLWDEALPEEPVEPTPTPDYHQEFYLYPPNHAILHAWLAGERTPRHRFELPLFDGEPVTYVDLTPAALRGKLAVAKAISRSTRRLRFGLPTFPRDTLPHPLV